MTHDPRETIYRVPQAVLDTSCAFLRDRGRVNTEGTALWVGRPDQDRNEVEVVRLFVPDQVTSSDPYMGVELTPEAHYTLPDHLETGELFACRIHSHPKQAFHSRRDDANAVITHQGAISIVVPFFARDPIHLPACALFQLEHGRGWLPLSPAEVTRRFMVTS